MRNLGLFLVSVLIGLVLQAAYWVMLGIVTFDGSCHYFFSGTQPCGLFDYVQNRIADGIVLNIGLLGAPIWAMGLLIFAIWRYLEDSQKISGLTTPL